MDKRAIISVFDKRGAADFARGLAELGYGIISTGGTYSLLKEAGIQGLTPIEEVTGFPEMMDGRVKTLHPRIHGGILAVRDNPSHMKALEEHGIAAIDIIVNNLYPFEATIAKDGVTLEEAIENIDIGGPSMLRAAAKNHRDVTVITDPEDYERVLSELRETGTVCRETRLALAAKVFAHTAHYDGLIAGYLRGVTGEAGFGEVLSLPYRKAFNLYYGENPHQGAAFYREAGASGGDIAGYNLIHGRELSFNNINDTHGALELLKEFDAPTAVASKHANPCGVGSGETIAQAFERALKADPVSVYGGVIALNRPVCGDTARLMKGILLDIIIAPSYTPEALEILTKKKNTRLLTLPDITKRQKPGALDIKKVSGGIIVQAIDDKLFPEGADIRDLSVVTKRKPTDKEYEDMLFAWRIVKHVKSNAIAIAKDNQSVGIGCGQVNRIWAAKQAIDHGLEALGAEALAGAALASDAFFPFDDCVRAAHEAGVTAVIQPGGSIRDEESLKTCDELGMTMVITGMRHFKH